MKNMPLKAFLLFALLPLAAACTMTTPSQVRTGQIVLSQQPEVMTRTLHDVSRADAQLLAKGYKNRGQGDMTATVSYDAADAAALKRAREQVSRIADDLKKKACAG